VNVEADLVSEHQNPAAAREEAQFLIDGARRQGCEVSLVDLSEEAEGGPPEPGPEGAV
jgi:hypothetical protein